MGWGGWREWQGLGILKGWPCYGRIGGSPSAVCEASVLAWGCARAAAHRCQRHKPSSSPSPAPCFISWPRRGQGGASAAAGPGGLPRGFCRVQQAAESHRGGARDSSSKRLQPALAGAPHGAPGVNLLPASQPAASTALFPALQLSRQHGTAWGVYLITSAIPAVAPWMFCLLFHHPCKNNRICSCGCCSAVASGTVGGAGRMWCQLALGLVPMQPPRGVALALLL